MVIYTSLLATGVKLLLAEKKLVQDLVSKIEKVAKSTTFYPVGDKST